ncbi:MAG TPA: argininosuccinate synthase [Acidimicrobiales bacterium]|nr:argininosuccinate synthase [Acidimicrobiales bacterium]
MAKRIVLAYSGGLDTSVAVRWMSEELDAEVIALAVDLGQGGDWDAVRARAVAAGAVDVAVVDARQEFGSDFVAPAIRANALYEGRYPLISSLSRPVIVKHLVKAAREHGADAIAHGCTGKGNDQVRFEVSSRALAPDLEVVAPVRTWGFTRDDSIEYAKRWGIPISATKASPYSVDQNLWGRTIECGILEDPWVMPPSDVYELTVPKAAGDEPVEIVIGFSHGLPVTLDGHPMPLHELVPALDRKVGPCGYGRIDMVENRRVGIKSREIYECPGALALLMAHADLEGMTLERDLAHEKSRLEPRWAELVYDGLWYSPLKASLDAFFVESQRSVTGEVRLRCEPGAPPDGTGACFVAGRRSPVALYDHDLATYSAADRFRHEDAEGFVRIFGLGIETWASKQGPADPSTGRRG